MLKFDAHTLSQSHLAFHAAGGIVVFGVMLLLFSAGLYFVYRLSRRYARPRDRRISFGLRAAALLVLFLPLFEPVLVTPDVVPDENFVAVLVDASASMNVPDEPQDHTRHDAARRLLYDRGVAEALEEHFKVRYYTFGPDARRAEQVRDAASEATGTNLSAAIGRALSDFRGLPLSGVVLLTDGADNSTDVPLNLAESLRERDVPLHVVGFGRESAENEREVLQASVGRAVEATTGAEIDVKVRSWREEPAPVAVNLYRNNELVHTAGHALKGGGKIDHLTLYYEPAAGDAQEYTVRLEEAPGEVNVENNAAEILIDPRRDTLRVLLVEGHPRRDFKFIKRALEDDQAVHVASILRTGTGKFYRQGIRRSDELAGGFPANDEELFGFRTVIFGDIEANHFSLEQLNAIERFVRQRGGGFAMLGGAKSFAEGAYWNNPVSELLPVEVDPGRRSVIPPSFGGGELDLPAEEQGFRFAPTRQGLESPIMRLTADPVENRDRWATMPGLATINFLGAVKPGATVLAEKPEDGFGDSEPLLVVQRYGKGRTAALATASTWRWQMLVDAEDQRHERFWRQFVRWLAASAPDRLEVALEGDRFSPGDEITVRINVYDPQYGPTTDATLTAVLSDAAGRGEDVTFRPDLGIPGSYTATLLPSNEGVHVLDVSAATPDGWTAQGTKSFLVRASRAEYQDAVLKRDFLERLADAAGGTYYTPSEADAIPANLRGRRTSTSVYHASYLWDMPLYFLLVLGLLTGEWAFRRRRSLP